MDPEGEAEPLAREAGYELVFTSDPTNNPVRASVGWLLGRLGNSSRKKKPSLLS